MKRHRSIERWGSLLPCFVIAAASPTLALAAPPAEDEGFSFEDASEDEAPPSDDEGGFEFDEGEDDESPPEEDEGEGEEEEEFIIAPVDAGEVEDSPPTEGEDDEWEDDGELSEDSGFVFEDISEDQEALDAELKSGEVQAEGEVGTIKGVVLNAKKEPLAGVYIRAKDTEYVARTGVDGLYELKLPPGEYTLLVELDLYKSNELPGVNVVEGEVASADVELVPMAGVMETFEVSDELNLEAEGALQEARKQKTSVNDGIDATEISKSGGGTVSSVAVRIVGATVVDGRYLFVRGLGHRYGNTSLNGARVPSPEPEIRTVPLDVFPSGALSAINVQKTFSPEVPGDFTGGSTQLITRDVPLDPTINLGAAVGVNTVTTGREMVTNGAFPGWDLVGLGHIPRGVPSSFPKGQKVGRQAVDPNTLDFIYSPAEVEQQGEALYTDYRVRHGARAPANYKLKATFGDSWATHQNGGRVGFLLAAQYQNEHQNDIGGRRQLGGDEGDVDQTSYPANLDYFSTTYRVAYNALLVTSWDINSNHGLELIGLYSRDAEDETTQFTGQDRANAGLDPITYNRIRYMTRAIAFTQLKGHHKLPRAANMEIDWFGSYSQARRDDPAMREMVFVLPNSQDEYSVDTSTGAVGPQLYLDFIDHTENAALDLRFPFRQWKGLDTKISLGAWVDAKQREFRARRYFFQVANGLSGAIPEGLGNVVNRDTIGGGVGADQGGTEPFALVEGTRPQDNYDAWSRNVAGYGSLDLPFVNWFKISGGLRVESNVISVSPFDLYALPGADPDPTLQNARLVNLDLLPAASLIFSPALPEGRGDFNIRMTGTRTVARPEFRELAPFLFRDYLAGFDKIGNPNLQASHVWNADLRFEWFPRASEVIALTGFYKYFDRPIETVTSASYVLSWENVEKAVNFGAEIEVRKSLDFLAPKSKQKARQVLADFSIGGNFSYIYSNVDLAPCRLPGNEEPGFVVREDCREEFQVATSKQRPLQGQAPWVVNAYLEYDNDDIGLTSRLLYNAVGPFITAVGAQGLPDIYQLPIHNLDLVISQRLLAYKRNDWGDLRNQLILSFEVNNILNAQRADRQGDVLRKFSTSRNGVDFILGLTWKY
jgi:hypothetical protein